MKSKQNALEALKKLKDEKIIKKVSKSVNSSRMYNC